ncbi:MULTISPECIES: N-6 DNA methylase [Glaesserella]|uniref:Restriction endonuclease subunit M n=2 Tax=Pasteurellaceae TaxID=712 RepID=A0A328BYU3_9PAST|nr:MULTISPECIES: N-6 DNA methylase [Glaesserella]AUI65854.1 restriction endonuclease subunit M [Glaesserella sp. 15-184]RAL18000.1 restriction endonuclease subunit M [Glaesserella australis]
MENFEQQFIQLFQRIAPHYRRSEVFYDFITLSALDMYQVTYRSETAPALLERFNHARARYSEEEFTALAQLLAITVDALTQQRYDFLGSVFMSLDLGDGYKGQYFTPSHIADFMAKVTLSDCQKVIQRRGFITLSEPSCGSGVMVIGCINHLIDAGYNPQQCLWVHCQDIDFIAAMMCYIQLSLLHIPACIVVGDTLLNETKIQMYTLAHLMGNWFHKLEQKMPSAADMIDSVNIDSENSEQPIPQGQLPLLIVSDDIGENEVIFY